MEFRSRWLLKPGPTAEQPITIVVDNPQSDEDGSRAKAEYNFTAHDFEMLLRDGAQALKWVRTGAWKPRG